MFLFYFFLSKMFCVVKNFKWFILNLDLFLITSFAANQIKTLFNHNKMLNVGKMPAASLKEDVFLI